LGSNCDEDGRQSIDVFSSKPIIPFKPEQEEDDRRTETTIGSKPGGEDDDDNTEDAPEHKTEDNGNSEDEEQDGIDSTNYNRTERKRKYESPVNDDKWMLHHKRLRDYCKNLTIFRLQKQKKLRDFRRTRGTFKQSSRMEVIRIQGQRIKPKLMLTI